MPQLKNAYKYWNDTHESKRVAYILCTIFLHSYAFCFSSNIRILLYACDYCTNQFFRSDYHIKNSHGFMKLVDKLLRAAIISTIITALIILLVNTIIYAGTLYFFFKMITTPNF